MELLIPNWTRVSLSTLNISELVVKVVPSWSLPEVWLNVPAVLLSNAHSHCPWWNLIAGHRQMYFNCSYFFVCVFVSGTLPCGILHFELPHVESMWSE